MATSVFEKGLKRDSEALDRIFRRLINGYETLTEDEQTVLSQYLQRWNTALQTLLKRTEHLDVKEKVE